MRETPVRITVGGVALDGDLTTPDGATGIVVFAHGSGSSRMSRRNRRVAAALHDAGLATLLFDLLSAEEEAIDLRTRELRFDIGLLAARLVGVTEWLARDEGTGGLDVGYFGASTGAAAALVAAAELPERIAAVVSRGGRPDLAGDALDAVRAPVLLLVGSADEQVLALNRQAAGRMPGTVQLEVVPGAGHLFEEAGALDEVARLAGRFLAGQLAGSGPGAARA